MQTRSEAEHVVQAEAAFAALDAVIAEQPAGLVAHDRVRVRSGARENRIVENILHAPEPRTRGGNTQLRARDVFAVRIA